MELNIVFAFSTIALLNAVSPGPNLALIVRSLSHSGSALAYSNVLGFSFGWLLHGVLLAFGISQIISSSENLFMSIKLIGASYLCWLGAKALISSWVGKQNINSDKCEESRLSCVVGCREGFITSSINPQTLLFFLAVIPQFIVGGIGNQTFVLAMILIFLCVSISWFCFIVWLFASFQRLKRNAMFARGLGALSGLSLISIGILCMVNAR